MNKTMVVILGVAIILLLIYIFSILNANKMIVVVKDNHSKEPLAITLHKTQDAHCGMVINSLEYSAQVVAPDGRTWFFHDLGGAVLFLAGKEYEDSATIWVYQNDKKLWLNAKNAYYSRTEETPMNYGFGAYETMQNDFVEFETMRSMMLRGENLTNPAVKKRLLNAR